LDKFVENLFNINIFMQARFLTALPRLPDDLIQILLDDFEFNRAKLKGSLDNCAKFKSFFLSSDSIVLEERRKHIPVNSVNQLGTLMTEIENAYDKKLCDFNIIAVTSTTVIEWLRDHKLCDEATRPVVQEFVNGEFFPPHVDLHRANAINYCFELGGQHVTTDFWQPRKEFAHLAVSPRTAFPYEKIELIDSFKAKIHQWFQLDTSVIHSVENMNLSERRIGLTMTTPKNLL